MSQPGCEELRASAAELALGVLDGEERARALAHARSCPACSAHLAELAIVAGAVLEAAPAREPPPGFESRVLDALARPRGRVRRAPPGFESRALDAIARPPRRVRRPRRLLAAGAPDRRRSRRLLAALAAAPVLAGAGATWVTLSATREERRLGAYYQSVLALAGGKYLTAWELRDDAGRRHGVVFAYQGDQPWIMVVLAGEGGPWRIAIATRAGGTYELGRFEPPTAGRVWGHELPVPVRDVATVRLTDPDGTALVARRAPG